MIYQQPLKRINNRPGKAAALLALAALLVPMVCLAVKRAHDIAYPTFEEKERQVYQHMSPADIQRDTDYGRVYASAEAAKAVLARMPHDPEAHRTLARAYIERAGSSIYLPTPVALRRRRLAPAIAEYRAALVADPANPTTKHNLAAAYMGAGEYQKAIDLWAQVTTYPPDAPGAEAAIEYCQKKLAQEAARH